MQEVFKTDKAQTRALLDFSAEEVRSIVKALDASADANLEMVRACGHEETRLEFAARYDEARTLAERLKSLGL